MAEITITVDTEQQKQAIADSFRKLDPRYLNKNPVLFVVELGTVLALALTIYPPLFNAATDSRVYYAVITVLLALTVLFANYAEAYAELEGEAQADSLRALQTESEGKRLLNTDTPVEDIGEDDYEAVASDSIEEGDVVFVDEGDIIPRDGTVIEGSASVDESAITGESEAVIRQSGGDRTSVVGGTEVLSDRIKIEVTTEAGESFLDEMIGLVENAQRQKTPNEIAMTILLSGLTLIFVVAVATMYFFGQYLASFTSGFTGLDIAELVALLVALMPTTIGALLAAIRVAGMTRVTRRNVIAKSGRAVESAGDLDTLILDKTGTITTGERVALDFHALGDATDANVVRASYQSSLYDETTEGRSIVELAERMNGDARTDGGRPDEGGDGGEGGERTADGGESTIEAPRTVETDLAGDGLSEEDFVPFSAETRMSGIDLSDGTEIRKGAVDAVEEYATSVSGKLRGLSNDISEGGGTPLAIAVDKRVVGIIELQDELKPAIDRRIEQIQEMGVETIMATGDNSRTARWVADQVGIDRYYAEFDPEEKIDLVEEVQNEGKLVGMTGDGTNDAPALAQANVGLAMNAGTNAAKEAGNMVDLDSNPSKIIEVVGIGKQLLMTRGALTTFSVANDVAKYFVLLPAILASAIPGLAAMDVLNLSTSASAVTATLVYNAFIIPILIPLALRGVDYEAQSGAQLLRKNLVIYGFGGLIAPFILIKVIDIVFAGVGVFQ